MERNRFDDDIFIIENKFSQKFKLFYYKLLRVRGEKRDNTQCIKL